MNRRKFVFSLGAGIAGLALEGPSRAQSSSPNREVALTFDDPQVVDYPGFTADDIDAQLRGALSDLRVKVALFVCGMRVNSPAGSRLLKAWNDEGHVLANHSYSHPFFHSEKISLTQFEADVQRGEDVIRAYPQFRKIFRFPFFKEGDTVEKRDGMRWWLAQHGYKSGRATIDASDWAIDDRLRKRLESNAKANLRPYRDFYLDHIWARSKYYDELTQKFWGRPVRHTVLLHHRLLNASFVKDLAEMYRSRGWRLVDAEYAFEDPIYGEQPKILPAGESLVWGISREKGAAGLRYPGEDDTYENPEMDRRGL